MAIGTVADCINVCLLVGKVRVPCVRFGRPVRNAFIGNNTILNIKEETPEPGLVT